MNRLHHHFRSVFAKPMQRLVADQAGQDLIEYALIAALLALGAVASLKALSTTVASAFTTISNSLSSAI
jgi:pilus assembly protein Flp/PilA